MLVCSILYVFMSSREKSLSQDLINQCYVYTVLGVRAILTKLCGLLVSCNYLPLASKQVEDVAA